MPVTSSKGTAEGPAIRLVSKGDQGVAASGCGTKIPSTTRLLQVRGSNDRNFRAKKHLELRADRYAVLCISIACANPDRGSAVLSLEPDPDC